LFGRSPRNNASTARIRQRLTELLGAHDVDKQTFVSRQRQRQHAIEHQGVSHGWNRVEGGWKRQRRGQEQWGGSPMTIWM
jgi:hypothetical protein